MASDLLTSFGLRSGDALSKTGIHCYAGGFLIWNFLWAYAITSTRPLKYYLKLDHNVNPREDTTKYGEQAVTSGKISQRTLKLLKRNESCHANNVEGFTLFTAAILFGLFTKLDAVEINRACACYSLARIAYTLAFLGIEKIQFSYFRSILWWTGNIICLRIFWKGGNNL